jgi:ADP-heptose:LPS heptosyltransferase
VAERISIDYATWPAVGHMAEALALANGYHRANPDAEIHLTVNAKTTTELADACPWVTAVRAVDVPNPRGNLYKRLPGVRYDPTPSLRFELPREARAFAEPLTGGGTQIAVKPAGGGKKKPYPSIQAWATILDALADRHPDLTVHLIGKLSRGGHPDTTAVSRADVDWLLQRFPFCRDQFDIGLFEQLAVIERCGVFISPHTGFAFCALAVGTPWLTISDGEYPEFFHTGVPFYSLLPKQVGDMSDERIAALLPELLDAADGLLSDRWSFWKCYHRHDRRCARLYGNRWSRARAFTYQAVYRCGLQTPAYRARVRLGYLAAALGR